MMRAVLTLALLLIPGPALAQNPEEIVQKVTARFAQTASLSANFTQTFHNAAMGMVERSTGTMVIQKPLRMRWEYLKPRTQTIVSNGKKLWIYYPAEKQAIVQTLAGVLNSGSPVLFLAGEKRLDELFNIKFLPGSANGGTISPDALSLTPKEQSLTITKIVIRWAEDYSVQGFTIYDWTGNKNVVEFADLKVNPPVDKKAFGFSPPKGVEVLDAPKF